MLQEIKIAAQKAFDAVRTAHPAENIYYCSLVTTGDALQPCPCVCTDEGLNKVLEEYRQSDDQVEEEDLRWSEADSPYFAVGEEYFAKVKEMFLEGGDHRDLPADDFEEECSRRFKAMEGALKSLDREGYFGVGEERNKVVINVVAPGDEDEEDIVARAMRLNPQESLGVLKKDLLEDS